MEGAEVGLEAQFQVQVVGYYRQLGRAAEAPRGLARGRVVHGGSLCSCAAATTARASHATLNIPTFPRCKLVGQPKQLRPVMYSTAIA